MIPSFSRSSLVQSLLSLGEPSTAPTPWADIVVRRSGWALILFGAGIAFGLVCLLLTALVSTLSDPNSALHEDAAGLRAMLIYLLLATPLPAVLTALTHRSARRGSYSAVMLLGAAAMLATIGAFAMAFDLAIVAAGFLSEGWLFLPALAYVLLALSAGTFMLATAVAGREARFDPECSPEDSWRCGPMIGIVTVAFIVAVPLLAPAVRVLFLR